MKDDPVNCNPPILDQYTKISKRKELLILHRVMLNMVDVY
jgi:hypothetical protein